MMILMISAFVVAATMALVVIERANANVRYRSSFYIKQHNHLCSPAG